MNQRRLTNASRQLVLLSCIAVLAFLACASHAAVTPPASSPILTNLAQVRNFVGSERRKLCSFRLDGVVTAVCREQGMFFLQDGSATDLIQMDWQNQPLQPGRRVVLEGNECAVARSGDGLKIGQVPIVDIDGSHPPIEGTGEIYLQAGNHPFKLGWFNDFSGCVLNVDYEGPQLRRTRIPDKALFRPVTNAATGDISYVNGIEYRCFEGAWERLPDFSKLTPTKAGTLSNFQIDVRSRGDGAALEFSGLLSIPREGMYKFYIWSDDGAQLFFPEPPPRLTVHGADVVPSPKFIPIGSAIMGTAEDSQWAQVEGVLNFVGQRAGGVELELGSGDNRMRLRFVNGGGEPPAYLLRSRIRAVGICRGILASDRIQAGVLIVPDWKHVRVLEVPTEFWPAFPNTKISDLSQIQPTTVRVTGKLREDGSMVLADDTGEVEIASLTSLPDPKDGLVEVLGKSALSGKKIVLEQAVVRKSSECLTNEPASVHVLTTAAEVQRLGREEALRAYPVKISGVLTFVSPNYSAAVIQDSTRGIYVMFRADGWKPGLPQVGESWEIEGVSNPADFSPVVHVSKARRIGPGLLPVPIRPTWDQLINGSLDAQYVEIQGLVTAVHGNRATLLTRAEKINISFPYYVPDHLQSYENSLVRIRGCLFPEWNRNTRLLQISRGIRIVNPTLAVDEPAPANPFDTVKKSAAELLLFDPQASALKRVRLCGQIVQVWDGIHFMMDGANGVRFIPKTNPELSAGDTVEVVGFPQLGGPSPVLREAVVRKTGSAVRPQPTRLPSADLLKDDWDSTLVQVDGTLLSVRENRLEQVLEMQSDLRTFVARVRPKDPRIASLEPASRLALTGVYLGQGGSRPEGREVTSFELLLNTPSDVRVLAAPAWWNARRLLVLSGILFGVLGLAAIWITLLRRKVEVRTAQLGREIEAREHVEQRRIMEQERTRVAQDLHDELGSGLTELAMLGSLARNTSIPAEKRDSYLEQLTGAARSLVTGLDEIVWAVNPQYDSTASLATYYSLFAQRFLNLAGIACRLAVAETVPDFPLESKFRHGTFLAFKEALNNVARHSGATEVRVAIAVTEMELTITVADNGCGFRRNGAVPGKDGLAGMEQRMQKLGGQCDVRSEPGKGTTVELRLPLAQVTHDQNSHS